MRRYPCVAGAVALALALALAGCGVSEPEDAGGTGGTDLESAYLLMDPAMRHEHGVLAIGAREITGDAALPVRVADDEGVTLRIGAARRSIEPRGGRLAWIHGPDGFVEWLAVGTDANPDSLLVEGKEAGVKELADLLAADVVERGVDTWELRAEELWDRTAFLELPEGVVEARPVLRSIDGAAVEADGAARTFAGLPAVGASAVAALVGVYASDHGALVLDASGGFELERWEGPAGARGCRLPVVPERGRYRYENGVLVLRSPDRSMKFAVSSRGLRGADGVVMSTLSDEDSP